MASGDLDSTFAGNGKKAFTFGGVDAARVVLVQPDRKILVAGGGAAKPSFCVARLNANGSPDAGFGTGGKATVDFGSAAFCFAAALQANGRIVVAGQRTAGDDFAVARLRG